MRATIPGAVTTLPVLLVALLATDARAQDTPTGWTSSAEVSLVLTSGNASSSSLGFRSTVERRWPDASWRLSGGGTRTESERTTRTATGTVDDFTIVEETETEVTAENYFVRSRYDRTVSSALFVFGGAGWERNTFAGVQNRYALAAGTGRTWFDDENRRLRTDLGFTYTLQDDVVEDPAADDSFAGLRGTVSFSRSLTETTGLTSELILDENLDETSDLRADWTTSVSVAISSRLALKTSYQLFFDNDPALVAVSLGDDQVLTPLEKVDSILTMALSVTF